LWEKAEGLAGLPARLAAHVQAAGLLLGVAEGVGVANGGGGAAEGCFFQQVSALDIK